MSNHVFLRIEQDSNSNYWCISSISRLNPGYEFLILANSQQGALQIVADISNGILKYPTVDQKGYRDITNQFTHLIGLTKVFTTA